MIPGLTRDEEHVYRLNGRVITGVTRVVDMLRDLSGVPRNVLENKREIGELVHRATELDAQEQLDHESIDPDIRPYMEGWWRFIAEVKPRWLSHEEYVYHTAYDYAGQLDHRVEINGEEGVLDKKTSAPSLCDAVQLSAYAQAKYHSSPAIANTQRLWILQLLPDGTYRLRRYMDHFHVFLAALTCYRFKNGGR